MRKKKILFHSNNSRAFTGFGKNAKNIIKYLIETDKYDIVELANGAKMNDPAFASRAWKTLGTMPDDDALIQQITQQGPDEGRILGYGAHMIDHIIQQEKPDIYLGVEDIWAFNGYYDKYWWDKINTMIWTTLDSLPILPTAVEAAPKIKNYYVWASFAQKALNEQGFDHVKTLRGSIDVSNFHRLEDNNRLQLRSRFGIDPESFIIGFVFRNQLRKSVPNLLDGFKMFLQRNPESKAKLLLHTHWSEGWDIPRFLMEKGIDPSLVLTTYFCKNCNQYEIKPFHGQGQDCRFCGGQKSQNTTNVASGVTEQQLNEVYNLMDVYCHPFTSGGQEIPVQEAKLTELITLVTNYSCGEDNCTPESGGLDLEWNEYREPGTQFIKASTLPSSISKQLSKVYKMNASKKRQREKKSRQFVIDNFSTEAIGKQLEDIFDSMPLIENFDFNKPKPNPFYALPNIENDSDFIKDLYENILKRKVDEKDSGHQHWMQRLNSDLNREAVYKYFIDVANKDLQEGKEDITNYLDNEGKENRIIIVAKSGVREVLYALSLLDSLKEKYPNHNLYFSTHSNLELLLDGCKAIHKFIPYNEKFNDALYLEGGGPHKGFFDIAILPEGFINILQCGHQNQHLKEEITHAHIR